MGNKKEMDTESPASGVHPEGNPPDANEKRIGSALLAVYNKEGVEEIARKLSELGVELYSTGGTHAYLKEKGLPILSVEGLTSFPSIFGGRVKTLHPKVFGGILARREEEADASQLSEYHIPEIDLVIVDLYPFEETLAEDPGEQAAIEKIDVGGIALIRAAAKNFNDVMVIPSRKYYGGLMELLEKKGGVTSLAERKRYAAAAFSVSAHYDAVVAQHFDPGQGLHLAYADGEALRYGENPHQSGTFFGDLEDIFDKVQGKALSYNNMLDVDSALRLIGEFPSDRPTVAILKHNNACGVASADDLTTAWKKALEGDPVSAFGGIIVTNRELDETVAGHIDEIFFEVLIAPDFSEGARALFGKKEKRTLLRLKKFPVPARELRTALNGVLAQDRDDKSLSTSDMETVTRKEPGPAQVEDLLFAARIVKQTRSNAIVLARDGQLLASGVGQTSRVDALKQAIEKARGFGFDLKGAAMASDAFFPFSDSVEIAGEAGIDAVVQPGGSKRDQDSIDHCNEQNMAMVFTGYRHFKH